MVEREETRTGRDAGLRLFDFLFEGGEGGTSIRYDYFHGMSSKEVMCLDNGAYTHSWVRSNFEVYI